MKHFVGKENVRAQRTPQSLKEIIRPVLGELFRDNDGLLS